LFIQPSKIELRRFYRQQRNDIPEQTRQEAAKAATHHLITHPLFKESERIACYLAYQKELETALLIQAIWKQQKKCYLPVLCEGKSLFFVHYNENDVLKPNCLSILEPENTACKCCPETLDLVIVPLVAFDKEGHRLGAGGGYYDRAFAFLHNKNLQKKPILLGYAYSNQEATVLPADPWDVHLDGVVTEQGVKLLARRD